MGSCLGRPVDDGGNGWEPHHRVTISRTRPGEESSTLTELLACMKHIRKRLFFLTTDQSTLDEDIQKLTRLEEISEQGTEGWSLVNIAWTHVCDVNDSLIIALLDILMHSISLPTTEAIHSLQSQLPLYGEPAAINDSVKYAVCLLLGHLAEKLAGHVSNTLVTSDVLHFIMFTLTEDNHPLTRISALVAVEKFSQTRTNKAKVLEHPFCAVLQTLEKTLPSCTRPSLEYQLAFCAQWSLDNYFPVEGRPPTYQSLEEEMATVNVMLNHEDVSEFLKISPDGHEARNDAASFESVRSTSGVGSEGTWYYEVTLYSEGIMQIGWATLSSTFQNHEGEGIGDDDYSFAFDGQRQLLWHKAKSERIDKDFPIWRTGDVLGCTLLHTQGQPKTLIFSLNGQVLVTSMTTNLTDLYPAGSFSCGQHARFNFGEEAFRYPPEGEVKTLHRDAWPVHNLAKVVKPWCDKQQLMQSLEIDQGSCQICFDKPAVTQLLPCEHSGFCRACATQFDRCPICRGDISLRVAMQRLLSFAEKQSRASSELDNDRFNQLQ